MREKLYAIPVNDAFSKDCECPICEMRKVLEDNAVEYTMGPSYMEGDIREKMDEMGFCQKHIKSVYEIENRLGMSLVLKTHFDKVIKDIKKISENEQKQQKQKVKFIFNNKQEQNSVFSYIQNLEKNCFVCNRINEVFDRYMETIIYLWKTDVTFKGKYNNSKGFCTNHYGLLVQKAQSQLRGEILDDFVKVTNELYIKNMERVRDDLEWFANKFDYKYANESWKNSKDAIPRALTKVNSIIDK